MNPTPTREATTFVMITNRPVDLESTRLRVQVKHPVLAAVINRDARWLVSLQQWIAHECEVATMYGPMAPAELLERLLPCCRGIVPLGADDPIITIEVVPGAPGVDVEVTP